MAAEISTALIGAAGGFAGALVALAGARHQAAKAVQAAVAQATAAYLGPLETAQRTAQRAVYAQLLTTATDYAEAVHPALLLARSLSAGPNRTDRGINPETYDATQAQINAVNDDRHVRLAYAHVHLEGPDAVTSAASPVCANAMALHMALYLASENARRRDIDPDAELLTNADHAYRDLQESITAFTTAASEHLGRRDLHPPQNESVRRRWWQWNRTWLPSRS